MLYKIGFLISGIVLFTSCGGSTSEEKQPQESGFLKNALDKSRFILKEKKI